MKTRKNFPLLNAPLTFQVFNMQYLAIVLNFENQSETRFQKAIKKLFQLFLFPEDKEYRIADCIIANTFMYEVTVFNLINAYRE